MVFLYDLFANRQSNAAALEFMVTVQSFKDHENLFGIFWLKTDSVILDNDPQCILLGNFRINMNNRHFIHFAELNGIADEVLKYLAHLAWNTPDLWQWIHPDLCARLFRVNFHVRHHISQQLV